MSVRSGLRLSEPFANYDPGSSSWKTSRLSLELGNLPEPSVIWPLSGMTRRGAAFELPTWAPLTAGSGSSSLLPTPAAGNFNDGESVESWQARKTREMAKGRNGNGIGTPLAMAVQLLPTPRASDSDRGQNDTARADRMGAGGPTIAEAVNLLPTPRASDGEKGGPNQRGSSGDLMLPSAVHQLLPTPRASDGPDRSSHGRTWSKTDRSLHTLIHLGEIGPATPPPSTGGPTSSDDPPQPPLF